MFAKLRRARLLAVAGFLTATAAVTAADGTPPPAPVVYAPGCTEPGCAAPVVVGDCAGGCVGPVAGGVTGLGIAGPGIGLFASNPPWKRKRQRIDGQNQPACATDTYPLSDWAYIRKYCGPTLIPGTCYGHFQTKWRKWEDHCPQGVGGCAPASALSALAPMPVYAAPPHPSPLYPSAATPAPAPSTPLPQPQPMPPKDDVPKKGPPKVDDPDAPKKPKIGELQSSIQLPPLPVIPTPAMLPFAETRR